MVWREKHGIYYPNATLKVREGYGHCQYMSSLGEQYGKVLEAYMA